MEWILYIVAAGFALLGVACLVLVVLGLPGTWVMIGIALVIEALDGIYLSDEADPTFTWWIIGLAILLAGVGELLEFLAGVLGAKKGGASRRGMIGSLIGGIVGAIVLTPLLPIPVVGTLIGALIGTFAGAVVFELSHPENNDVRDTVKPAVGATIGRLLGTLAKVPIAIVVWLTLSVAAFWP